MYEDLADATESLKEKGYTHTFELGKNAITCKELNVAYKAEDLEIVESYTHDEGTDPGSESTIYAIRADSGIKGTLIVSYGMYAQPEKARIIDSLLDSQD